MKTYSIQLDRPLRAAQLVSAPGVGDCREDATPIGSSIGSDNHQSEIHTKQIEELLTQISTKVTKSQLQHVENLQQLKTMAVGMAVMIVNQLVGNSESLRDQRLEQLLEEALNRAEPAIGIRLHPKDLVKLERLEANLSIDLQQLNTVADQSLAAGECHVDYATYELTSSLSQQLEDMSQRMLEVVHEQ